MAESVKKTKAQVEYGAGMRDSHCSLCRHYLGKHECSKVLGHIDPGGWCRLFEHK